MPQRLAHLSNEEILALIKDAAERLGRTPTTSQLEQMTDPRVDRETLRRRFGGYEKALAKAELQRSDNGRKRPMMELFLVWASVVRDLKKLPTMAEYEAQTRKSPMRLAEKFKRWGLVPHAMMRFMLQQRISGEWEDVLRIIENGQMERRGRQMLVPPVKSDQRVGVSLYGEPGERPLALGNWPFPAEGQSTSWAEAPVNFASFPAGINPCSTLLTKPSTQQSALSIQPLNIFGSGKSPDGQTDERHLPQRTQKGTEGRESTSGAKAPDNFARLNAGINACSTLTTPTDDFCSTLSQPTPNRYSTMLPDSPGQPGAGAGIEDVTAQIEVASPQRAAGDSTWEAERDPGSRKAAAEQIPHTSASAKPRPRFGMGPSEGGRSAEIESMAKEALYGPADVESPEEKAVARGRKVVHRWSPVIEELPVYGRWIGHPAMLYAPVNEAGVNILFGALATQLGYVILRSQSGFPDVEAMRLTATGVWQRVRIEIEYESANFIKHYHEKFGCDVIVCWRHNWKDCPVEVVELCKLFGEGC